KAVFRPAFAGLGGNAGHIDVERPKILTRLAAGAFVIDDVQKSAGMVTREFTPLRLQGQNAIRVGRKGSILSEDGYGIDRDNDGSCQTNRSSHRNTSCHAEDYSNSA